MSMSPQPRDIPALAPAAGWRRLQGVEVAGNPHQRVGQEGKVGSHRLDLGSENIRGGSVRHVPKNGDVTWLIPGNKLTEILRCVR